MMALFEAYEPTVEVNGETVLSVVEGLSSFKDAALTMLKENGIDDPQPGKWYPQQAWLDTFKRISESLGFQSLKQIGKTIPEHAQWPPHVNSIRSALESIDTAYHMNHRNGRIGNYKFVSTGDNSGLMVCDNPYPDEFDQGIIEAVAEKFKKGNQKVEIEIDQTKPKRSKGADSTTYIIRWE